MDDWDNGPALFRLPQPVLQEVKKKLRRREEIGKVVSWLMGQYRGPFEYEGQYIMRKHVEILNRWMQLHAEGDVSEEDEEMINSLSANQRMLVRSFFDKVERGLELQKLIEQNKADGKP
jgi:hypothetical protein